MREANYPLESKLGIVKLAHRAKRVPKMKVVLALALGASALAPSQPKVSSETRVA